MDKQPVKIYSDGVGIGEGTVVLDQNGNRIANVSGATVWMRAGELVTVDLTIVMPVINVQAFVDGMSFDCPVCGDSISHSCHEVCQHEDTTGNGRCDDCNITLAPPQAAPAMCLDTCYGVFTKDTTCIRDINHDGRHFDGHVVWGSDHLACDHPVVNVAGECDMCGVKVR